MSMSRISLNGLLIENVHLFIGIKRIEPLLIIGK